MPATFDVTVAPTFRDLSGRFARAEEELLTDIREQLREVGRRFVIVLRDEAPSKTGKFAQSIGYRTDKSGKTLSMSTYSNQPLGKWIVGGTRPHDNIRARNANALYFFWPKIGKYVVVPKAGGFKTHVRGNTLFVGKGYIDHPGTKPNDYVTRAYVRMLPEINVAISRISARFVKRIAGETT